MKIAENVELLELKSNEGTIYPVLIWDDNDLILIDTNFPMQTEVLKKAVQETGHEFEKITKVILTHQDLDHVGSAKTLSTLGADIMAHELEAPYIQGDVTSIRLSDMESRLSDLSEDELSFYERAKKAAPYFYVPVNKLLKDGETLDICGGIKILHTPGHTPGHIAVLLEESNIIIAGDAANILNGQLVGANPQFTRNMELANQSFNKINNFNPSSIVCFHGGIYNR